MSRGYQDFKAGEFTVYNMINNRNLTVRRPFQNQPGLSGSHPTATIAMNRYRQMAIQLLFRWRYNQKFVKTLSRSQLCRLKLMVTPQLQWKIL